MITFVRTNGPANGLKATRLENESDLGFQRRKPKQKTDLENRNGLEKNQKVQLKNSGCKGRTEQATEKQTAEENNSVLAS